MDASIATKLGDGAEVIESIDWLHEFAKPYQEAWNSHDPEGVARCVAEDVVWEDPALPEPARGRDEVASFVATGVSAFSDLRFAETGEPAISDDRLVAYLPWRMLGTNDGPLDPPGFAPTGNPVDIEGIDVWQFRSGLIWRYRAVYDFSEFAQQLGLLPPRGGAAESVIVRLQRVRSRLPL